MLSGTLSLDLGGFNFANLRSHVVEIGYLSNKRAFLLILFKEKRSILPTDFHVIVLRVGWILHPTRLFKPTCLLREIRVGQYMFDVIQEQAWHMP